LKLIRDEIPEYVRMKGGTIKTRIASNKEYEQLLHEKLVEEVNEFLEARNTEELADVLEVVRSLGDLYLDDFNKLEEIRKQKAREKGSFKKRIVME